MADFCQKPPELLATTKVHWAIGILQCVCVQHVLPLTVKVYEICFIRQADPILAIKTILHSSMHMHILLLLISHSLLCLEMYSHTLQINVVCIVCDRRVSVIIGSKENKWRNGVLDGSLY